jgi:hypothetical protein
MRREITQNAVPRYIFAARVKTAPPLEEFTARGKKTVIIALRYFSASAGDALSIYRQLYK